MASGQVLRIDPRSGKETVLAQLNPGLDNMTFHALRAGNAEVLASGLKDPVGLTFDPAGRVLVAESGAGRVVSVSGNVETVVDGLQRPHGIAVAEGMLYIVDTGAKQAVAVGRNTNALTTIASGLPVGPPPGVEPKPRKGMPPFSGPQGPFADIAVGGYGTLYVSADGEGSVLSMRRT